MRVHVRVLERMCTVFLTPVNVLVPAAGAGDAAATAGMGSALDRVAGASKFLKRNMSAKKTPLLNSGSSGFNPCVSLS